ncbi:STAS domain-containing protein [Nitrincola sp. MINF-07-Sa-05]|uniref:STAS domain-containing protein n=1 Tax=Nitrincola salilacus TaxID=3400273 RepID=UPI0039185350
MQDQIFFTRHEGVCYFKLCGELRYTLASGLDDLIERLFKQDEIACSQVVIDLNEASFMDSTHVGLLASLARHCLSRGLPRPTLFSTHPEVNELLINLNLDQVFELVAQPTDQQVTFAAVDEADHTELDKARMILRAHEALLDLNDANRVAFQPVVDMLRKDVSDKEE